ncbi:MAG TPA: RNA polymerase sigma factor [Acidimicrobiales bacterium]|nr:RNA polymerase sigma factor [Acidimicrobiales bacterium]
MIAVRVDRPPAGCQDDAACIDASLADPARFAVLFDRHGRAVASYLAHRAPASAVEDLVSETFLAAFRSRDRYDLGQPDARPWLLGVATNVLRHHWRAEGRRRALVERLRRWAPDCGDPPAAGADAASSWPDADRVRRALNRLDPGTRDAVMLLAVADLTYDEIARSLGVPVGTVRSRIFRGRRRLRELLKEDPPWTT